MVMSSSCPYRLEIDMTDSSNVPRLMPPAHATTGVPDEPPTPREPPPRPPDDDEEVPATPPTEPPPVPVQEPPAEPGGNAPQIV